ncbi:MAG: hypothetical protein HUJ70_05580 [Pseudobutyrivibrio sp.]|nr:hypothetical protein [Pseudobutyrivibrio sp.]MCF0185860.1 hypothetical protein [Bacteroidaceae bacterium]
MYEGIRRIFVSYLATILNEAKSGSEIDVERVSKEFADECCRFAAARREFKEEN